MYNVSYKYTVCYFFLASPDANVEEIFLLAVLHNCCKYKYDKLFEQKKKTEKKSELYEVLSDPIFNVTVDTNLYHFTHWGVLKT